MGFIAFINFKTTHALVNEASHRYPLVMAHVTVSDCEKLEPIHTTF